MPLSDIDFGKSIVPLSGTDAFFLDTNILVAYMYEKHDKHVPCFMLLSYLIKNEVVLCTSEIVIVELINSLARVLYIDDSVTAHMAKNPNDRNIKKIEKYYQNNWGNVIKTKPEILKRYSALAIGKVGDFITQMLLIECTDSVISDVMDIMSTTPLASADAMIISSALNFGCQYLFSIDKDMSVNDKMDVVCCSETNDTYLINDMMTNLDLKGYLMAVLGEEKLLEKFPTLI